MSSILSRIPNLIPSTPTSAPQDAMIASQKTHIDELVQKTRTLDNTIKSLQEQLSNSRAEWQAERKEWVDGCDSLLACYRIAHLRSNVLLAQERVALAHERDITRRERVAVIQRDYNLILFKAREKEIELEADRLKEELRGTANGNVALVVELREKLAEGMRELKEKAALLRDAEKAREAAEEQTTRVRTEHAALQAQLSSARTEHAALQAQLSSARTNVDRLTLRLEDAQTVIGEKERLNGELQQEKATLKSQVEKWKSLDDRGGAEVEELHKQRATLESQIKRLESRLAEEQNKVSAHEKAIQKEHKKIEKLQQALEEQARIAEEATTAAAETSQHTAADAKANKKLQKLMAALEEQTDKAAKAEEEAALLEEQSRDYKEKLDSALRQIEKLSANSRSRDSQSRSRARSDHEVEVKKPAPVNEPGNGKKTAKKPDKGKSQQKSQPPASDSKGKRKARPEDDRTDAMESETDLATKPTKSKTRKNRATAKESQANTDVNVDPDDAAAPKKKKMRKLNVNLFAPSKPDSLDWVNQFNLGGGLDIPTQLSPLKVPARSLAGKSASTSLRMS